MNLVSTGVAIALVDRTGRRALFLEGGAQMFIAQVRLGCSAAWVGTASPRTGEVWVWHTHPSSLPVPPLRPSPLTLSLPSGCLVLQLAVGILLGVAFGTYNTTNLPDSITYVALVLICIFVAGEAG